MATIKLKNGKVLELPLADAIEFVSANADLVEDYVVPVPKRRQRPRIQQP